MTDPKPLELSRARRHDILQAPMPGTGRLQGTYVMGRCNHPEVAYFDEVSKKSFPNIGALVAALKNGGRFHIAVRCVKHKWLEELPQEFLEQLREATTA